MALLDRGAGEVAQGFLAAQPDEEGLAAVQAIERETGADEGHRASVGGDVDPAVGVHFFGGFDIGGFGFFGCHEFLLSGHGESEGVIATPVSNVV